MRYQITTDFGSDFEAKFHQIFIKQIIKLMLPLQRDCKFSKINVFITSAIFTSKSIDKGMKN